MRLRQPTKSIRRSAGGSKNNRRSKLCCTAKIYLSMISVVIILYWLYSQLMQSIVWSNNSASTIADASNLLSDWTRPDARISPPQSKDLQQGWMKQQFQQHSNNNLRNVTTPVSVGGLPQWLRQGKNKHVQVKGGGNVQYTSPVCEGFNNTFRRPRHGCQRNPDTKMVHCAFENFRVDVDKIECDLGGEPLESVMGRPEEPEFPRYQMGAFSTERAPKHVPLPGTFESSHYIDQVLNNMEFPTADQQCAEVRKGTTMFITRYEYVNLYHTMTDWFNFYHSLPPDEESVNVVFLDAHAEGSLDSVWSQMSGRPYEHVKHLKRGGVCFEKAILIPPGYASPLFSHGYKPRCPSQLMVEHFSDFVLQRYGLGHEHKIEGNVVIIDRIAHISHPRSSLTGSRIFSNLDVLESEIKKVPGVTSVRRLQFETMSFQEQLRAIRRAHVLIGNHGAGLTHLLFLSNDTAVIEFSPFAKDFFVYLSDWKGESVDYNLLEDFEALELGEEASDSTRELPSSLIEKAVSTLTRIMEKKTKHDPSNLV